MRTMTGAAVEYVYADPPAFELENGPAERANLRGIEDAFQGWAVCCNDTETPIATAAKMPDNVAHREDLLEGFLLSLQ